MHEAIAEPRKEVSKYAPKIETFNIDPEKIKDVIGRGGDMITKIILEASNVKTVNDKDAVKVDLEDDGRVIIYHTDKDIIAKTRKMIEDVVREVEEGKVYTGKVVKVEDFGAFVELWPGCEGLVHVSQLDHKRVEKPSDVVAVGDEIMVKSLGYDNRGRLNLSRKECLPKPEKRKRKKRRMEKMTRELKINGIYRHFKNKLYKVLLIANDSETNNDINTRKVVVYQALYGDQLIWVRDYDMFLSEVDHEKYPDVKQQYRFQELTMEEALKEMVSSLENEYPDMSDDARNTEAYKRLGFGENEQVLTRTKNKNLERWFLNHLF